MKSKIKKNFPRLTIERCIMDNDGKVTAIDIHDEKFGTAIFFQEGVSHYHGFLNEGQYNGK